jgi:hypothetical protein
MAGATVFLTLPLGILLGSILGARLGARAVLRLLFPFPTIVYHLAVVEQRGLAEASAQAAASLGTVPMVFAWAIPFAWLSRRVGHPIHAFAVATAVSFVVRQYAPPASPAVAIALTAVAAVLLHEPGPPLAAPVPARNLAGRLLSIVGILAVLAALGRRADAFSVTLVAVLGAFPRMTMELAFGTWLAAGPVAARQALSGLPAGLCAALVWCCGLVWLPPWLPAPAVLVASGLGAAAVTAGLAWPYYRRGEGERVAA